jgi:3-phenylpropionate/cinnamic acid dioxygenase small subunit
LNAASRVETGQAWADEPASRTRHFVTNVRILAQADDELVVGCNYWPIAHPSRAITTATSAPAATRCAATAMAAKPS